MPRADLPKMIPITRLRHLYLFLREFGSKELELQVAEALLRKGKKRKGLLRDSIRHFELYDNRGEALHDRDGTGGLTEARRRSNDPANVLLSKLADGLFHIESDDGLGFSYVDYEVSPDRTKDSEYENGEKASKGRAFDVLLCSSDGLPIVGEIKAHKSDRTPVFGLIQGLTYLVELTSPAQRERLLRCYREAEFEFPEGGPYADLYLLMIGYRNDAPHEGVLKTSEDLARALLDDDGESSVGKLVRRFACLNTDLTQDEQGMITLSVVSQVTSPYA